jgi:ferredoxin
MEMKVTADEEKCVAAGLCASIAPDVFDQRDEDGVVVVLNSSPLSDSGDEVHRAAASCPARAILVKE